MENSCGIDHGIVVYTIVILKVIWCGCINLCNLMTRMQIMLQSLQRGALVFSSKVFSELRLIFPMGDIWGIWKMKADIVQLF